MIRGFIPLPFYILVLVFIFWRISSGFKLDWVWNLVMIHFFGVILLILVLHAIASEHIRMPVITFANGFLIGFIWIASCVFPFEFIFRFIWKDRKKLRVSAALVLSLGLSLYALNQGLREPSVKQIEIRIKNLPKKAEGFSLVQLSDLHLGAITSTTWLSRVIEKTNSLNPDIVVITGDVVGGLPQHSIQFKPILSKLRARQGVYAVIGNHDLANQERTLDILTKGLDITYLRNRGVTLSNGIQLAGIDDSKTRKKIYEELQANLNKALVGLDTKKTWILLSHSPDIFPEAVKKNVSLQLSAHTHAGQMPPLTLYFMLFKKYWNGLYRCENSHLYTSSGTGTWEYLPMRLFTQNEIVRFILVKAK